MNRLVALGLLSLFPQLIDERLDTTDDCIEKTYGPISVHACYGEETNDNYPTALNPFKSVITFEHHAPMTREIYGRINENEIQYKYLIFKN